MSYKDATKKLTKLGHQTKMFLNKICTNVCLLLNHMALYNLHCDNARMHEKNWFNLMITVPKLPQEHVTAVLSS